MNLEVSYVGIHITFSWDVYIYIYLFICMAVGCWLCSKYRVIITRKEKILLNNFDVILLLRVRIILHLAMVEVK